MRQMRIVEANLEALELKYGRLSVRQPAAERKLLASLGEGGQQSPVIAVAVDGRYVVIDGHKRVRALEKLKADVVRKASLTEIAAGLGPYVSDVQDAIGAIRQEIQ